MKKSFDALTDYQRRTMMQFFCLAKINRPPGVVLTDVLDGYHRRLGLPEDMVMTRVHEQIMGMDRIPSWVDFFLNIGVSAGASKIFEILKDCYMRTINQKAMGGSPSSGQRSRGIQLIGRNHPEELEHLPPAMQKNLRQMGVHKLRPMQKKVLKAFSNQKDVVVVAPVGTGKTIACCIAALHRLISFDRKKQRKYFFLVVPERQTAQHVWEVLDRIARGLTRGSAVRTWLCDRRNVKRNDTRSGRHCFVGPPAQLEQMLRHLDINDLIGFFLMEGDTLLDTKFKTAVTHLIQKIPQGIRCGVLSTSNPKPIKDLTEQIVDTNIAEVVDFSSKLNYKHWFIWTVDDKNRMTFLLAICNLFNFEKCIVFCNRQNHRGYHQRQNYNQNTVKQLVSRLVQKNETVDSIDSNTSQQERDKIIKRFCNGSFRILVCYDVPLYHLHAAKCRVVINYDLPQFPETYARRIAVCGDQNVSCHALSFSTNTNAGKLKVIQEKCQVKFQELPEDVNALL